MTTSELAAKLGISRATISRVLNNHPTVKEETRQMVLDAIKKYNYTPNETARSLVMGRALRIAVVVFSEPAFFWQQVQHGVDTAKNDLKALGVTTDYFVTDILHPEQQLALLKTLPAKGYDGIIIAPNDINILGDEVNRLCNEGFPVVVINVEMPMAGHLCYIGCNYNSAGALAAELLAKFMGAKGDILLVTLDSALSPIEQRVTGFRQELARHSAMQIAHICRFGRTVQDGEQKIYETLKQNPGIQGVFVSIGALEATAEACRRLNRNDIAVVGYDLNEKINEYLEQGYIKATICHEPFNQGYYSVKLLYRFLDKGLRPASPIMYTKLEAVFKTNAKYYLNEQPIIATAQE